MVTFFEFLLVTWFTVALDVFFTDVLTDVKDLGLQCHTAAVVHNLYDTYNKSLVTGMTGSVACSTVTEGFQQCSDYHVQVCSTTLYRQQLRVT